MSIIEEVHCPSQIKKTYLVTCALPYANNHLHLGHILEQIQADIWVRYLKLRGHTVYFFGADDAHGTPIMLQAEKEGISISEKLDWSQRSHEADVKTFNISFDLYSSTHQEAARILLEEIYSHLVTADAIKRETIEQLYDGERGLFLSDRMVQGDCPICQAPEQYGDHCEVCGATYRADELGRPRSVLSGTTPKTRRSEHLFFRLSRFEARLQQWFKQAKLQRSIIAKLQEWLDTGLKDWDISRDAPYFGFQIPGEDQKYFYVWLDAPIGYISTSKLFFDQKGIDFRQFWNASSEHEVHHFIGKDIAYFHTLFWPAVLHSANFRLPTSVHVHGFVTVNGQKMSKSRGTFIFAHEFAKHLPPEALRYYYATKLNGFVEDVNLSFSDLVSRVNSDLVNKVVNLASRSAKFIQGEFEGRLSDRLSPEGTYARALTHLEPIGQLIFNKNFSQAVREIMRIADEANEFFDMQAPWKQIQHPSLRQGVHEVCTETLNIFKLLVTLLSPITPELSERASVFLACPLDWDGLYTPLLSHKIAPFTPLLNRLSESEIEGLQCVG